jgi:hypothetical protein
MESLRSVKGAEDGGVYRVGPAWVDTTPQCACSCQTKSRVPPASLRQPQRTATPAAVYADADEPSEFRGDADDDGRRCRAGIGRFFHARLEALAALIAVRLHGWCTATLFAFGAGPVAEGERGGDSRAALGQRVTAQVTLTRPLGRHVNGRRLPRRPHCCLTSSMTPQSNWIRELSLMELINRCGACNEHSL